MDARVLVRFQDRETGRIYRVGETYSGSADRVSELVKGGWVAEPVSKKRKKK